MGSRPHDADRPSPLGMGSRPEEQASQAAADRSLNRPGADLSSGAADVSMPGLQPILVKRVLSASLNRPAGPQWLLFNDFSVSPAPPSEVTQLYGVQKVPCLLYYTQVWLPDLGFSSALFTRIIHLMRIDIALSKCPSLWSLWHHPPDRGVLHRL